MNRQQRRIMRSHGRRFPAGYVETTKVLADAMASWLALHPRAPLCFRLPAPHLNFIAPIESILRELSGTDDTRALLATGVHAVASAFGASAGPTVQQLRAAIAALELEPFVETVSIQHFGRTFPL